MTFLHKLAKRLARIPAAAVLFLLPASCGDGSAHDYLGPDSNISHNLVSVSVSPRDPLVALGDSVHFEALGWFSNGQSTTVQIAWSATGGSISANGWFRPASLGQFTVRASSVAQPNLRDSVRVLSSLLGGIARLEISPALTAVPRGATQQFTAMAVMQDGSTTAPTVSWSATGGTITPSGLFTASGAIGTATVSATLGAGIATASSEIAIQPPMLTQLLLNPSVATMEAGEARQLTVAASWSDGSSTLPSVIWRIEGGTLGSDNVFTAGEAPGSYRVIVSSPAFSRADTTVVWVLPRLVGLRLSPSSATLLPGATQPMQAFAIRNDGSEGPAGVQWSATGGSVALTGAYTAGATLGSNRVVATLRGLNGQVFADTAQMDIAGGGGTTLTQVSVTPKTAVVVEGNPLQFAGSGNLSDGRTVVPAIDWNATGGSIDTTGLYMAPQTTGSFRVIGKHRGGTKADTAIVVVGPNLVTFRIAPKIDTMVTGQTHQYSATLTWSDGLTHPVTISWSTTGGVISESGAYSPGALVGSFLVVAACSCGAADTAAVTVRSLSSPASPTLMSLNLQPAAVALALGGMQQFSPTGTWSDGTTGPVGVLYVATGGSISASGFYVGGTTPGTYTIVAIQQGGAKVDTSVVTINAGPTLNQLVLNPGAVTLAPGATQAFSVAGSWSDGSSTVPSATFSATGGTITPAGIYTAGTSPGSYRVIAIQQGGALADTAVVTIPTPTTATLTQLVMTPVAPTVAPGSMQQFSVSALWSDGASTLPTLSFSATGGTVSPTGLYSAGSAVGTYRVIVQGGAKADTSVVTIANLVPPTLSYDTIPLTIRRFSGSSGIALVSNGIPLPPGRLTDADLNRVRVLAGNLERPAYIEALHGRHADGSLRAILIQFQVTIGTAPMMGMLDLRSPPDSARIAKSSVTLSLPAAAALPSSADYLVSTRVGGRLMTLAAAQQAGLPASVAAQEADFGPLAQQLWSNLGSTTHRGIAVYDHPMTYYQYWLRTADPLWWQRATLMAIEYRNYVDPLGKLIAPWMVNTESLVMHYWLTGDDATRRAIGTIADGMLESCRGPQYDNPDNAYWIGGTLGDDRMRARCLMSAIDARLVEAPFTSSQFGGWTSYAALTTALNDLLPTQQSSGAFGGSFYYGGQKNYMVGMLLAAIVRYYEEIAPDSRIPAVVQRGIDYLWNTQWIAGSQGLQYISNNLNVTEGGTNPEPGLNDLILPAFGWYFGLTGDVTYKSRGDALVTGVRLRRNDWLGWPMQFDQAYYRFANYVAYRQSR